MKRWIIISVALIAVLSVTAFFLVRWNQKEPVYQGKPISDWIEEMTGTINSSRGFPTSDSLGSLVNADLDPEVVPYLGQTLHRGRGIFSKLYSWAYPRIPKVVQDHLQAPDPVKQKQLRYRAALILYYMGSDAATAASDLAGALDDNSPNVRRMAATALGAIESAKPNTTEALIGALNDPSPEVRQAAVGSLAFLESDSSRIVTAIAERLEDPNEEVRVQAARSLKQLGKQAKPAVTELKGALDDKNDDVFRFAVMTLGRIGPPAREIVPTLKKALKQGRPHSKTAIRWALSRIQAEE